MQTNETKYLSEFYHLPEFKGLEGYKKNGGYKDLEKALKMQPQAIIEVDSRSNCVWIQGF